MRILSLFVAALTLVGVARAGATLRVGPARTFTQIGPAVTAAVDGDLILVDPGSYLPFHVPGKGISIVAAGAAFTMQQPGSVPAIRIDNVVYPRQVSVIGAFIDYTNTNAPAIVVRDNTGAVRFSALQVTESVDLGATPARAVMRVVNTDTFWLLDSEIWSNQPRTALTLSPWGGFNDGVSALEMKHSDGIVQNVRLRGYDAGNAPNSGYGGDAVRVIGDSSVGLRDRLWSSPQSSILRGGSGGEFGGNALHYLGSRSNTHRMTTCGIVMYQPGTGFGMNGGKFALNHDGGVIGSVPFQVERLPIGCAALQSGSTTVAASTASVGSTVTSTVFTPFASRDYRVAMSLNTLYSRKINGLFGRSMLDASVPFFTFLDTLPPSFGVVNGSGTTSAGVPRTVSFTLPSAPSLVGSQIAVQTVTGPPGGTTDAFTFASLIVVVP